jgi:hypothetical protein
MSNEFVEIENENKGRKLIARESTFCIDEGTYHATITDAFWYKTEDDRNRVMLVFLLEDETKFKSTIDGDWIEKYPFANSAQCRRIWQEKGKQKRTIPIITNRTVLPHYFGQGNLSSLGREFQKIPWTNLGIWLDCC